ncbi:MAG TPA: hypothetical protein V6C76_04575 [Drouetiella sp.]
MHGHDRPHGNDAVRGEVQNVLNASDQFNLAKGSDAQSMAGQLFQAEVNTLRTFQKAFDHVSNKVDMGAAGFASAEQLLGPQTRSLEA